MVKSSDRNALIGKKVRWRMNKNDGWKAATIVDESMYLLNAFSEDETENTCVFQQSRAFLQSATIEYLDCIANDGRRFRAYAILSATIYPLERCENSQWENPAHDIADLPMVVADDYAYIISQIFPAGDESEFHQKQPDLTPLLAAMFQV